MPHAAKYNILILKLNIVNLGKWALTNDLTPSFPILFPSTLIKIDLN
jgi:hypothetical protein